MGQSVKRPLLRGRKLKIIFRGSSMVERRPVKAMVPGSSPGRGALRQAQCKLMIWYTYILLCDQKTFYVGMTNDLASRLAEHKNKQSFFTKKFFDIELVYKEEKNN